MWDDETMLEKLTLVDFTPLVGTDFRLVREGEAPLVLRLDSTTDLSRGEASRGGLRAPFSLWLHGPLAPVMPQGTYRLEHDTFPPLDIFIVPRGPKGGAMEYEATFN